MSFVLPFVLGIFAAALLAVGGIFFVAWFFSDEELFDEVDDLGRRSYWDEQQDQHS